jgi:hypothetical protein
MKINSISLIDSHLSLSAQGLLFRELKFREVDVDKKSTDMEFAARDYNILFMFLDLLRPWRSDSDLDQTLKVLTTVFQRISLPNSIAVVPIEDFESAYGVLLTFSSKLKSIDLDLLLEEIKGFLKKKNNKMKFKALDAVCLSYGNKGSLFWKFDGFGKHLDEKTLTILDENFNKALDEVLNTLNVKFTMVL